MFQVLLSMGVNFFCGTLPWLEVHLMLYFPEGESFRMNHTVAVRFGNVHKGNYDVFTFLMVI